MSNKSKGVLPVIVAVEGVARKYTGRILTVIDSVLPEGQQNKAAKDVIRSILHDLWNDPIWEQAGQEVEFEDVELSDEDKEATIAEFAGEENHTAELSQRMK